MRGQASRDAPSPPPPHMLRSQRILVIVGLLVAAWLLHVNMCDWAIARTMTYWSPGSTAYRNSIILGWESSPAQNTNAVPSPGLMTGVVAYDVKVTGVLMERSVSWREALLVGVMLPLALLFAAGYLWLGGRRASRVSRGLCTKCGYDLRGGRGSAVTGPLAKCPECGTPVS